MPPIDPTIPLAAGQPSGAAPQPQMNPISMIGQWAQIQNAMNQNRLFQQTFTARQKAGQILAAAPDLESGLTALTHDPDTAPFAGETINTFRQSMLAVTQQQGELQKQSDSGLQTFLKFLPSVAADPTEENWNAVSQTALATLNPQIRDRVASAMGSLRKSLIDGLPEEPEARQEAFRRRFAGLALAGGLTPEGMSVIAGGKNETLEGGGYKQPGLAPFEGGFKPKGPAYAVTLPPTVAQTPGENPTVLGGVNGLAGPTPLTRTPMAGGGNGLLPSPVTSAPLPAPAAAAPTQSRVGNVAVPAEASPDGPISGTGKPLYDPQALDLFLPKSSGTSAVGLPILSQVQLEQQKKLQENFSGDQLRDYNQSISAKGSLEYMEAALDEMAKSGGMLTPGNAAGARVQVANTFNTIAAMIGKWDPSKPQSDSNKPPFDPKGIMAAEDWQKETERMKLMVTTSMLGTQREAGATIANIGKSIPSIENSYLGGKLVIAGIRAALQRVQDQREFLIERSNRHGGSLVGGDEAFNKAFPAEAYANKVLQDFGLTKTGKFASPEAVKRAVQQGMLPPDQARQILIDQFGMGKGRK